jgi:hypothetical protein
MVSEKKNNDSDREIIYSDRKIIYSDREIIYSRVGGINLPTAEYVRVSAS